ncbi:MAG: SRPBCC family protein [Solirubrobacteraceae bacterium]|nr:SRPBCC family protein [Solirubrobacteraceae bacterium]
MPRDRDRTRQILVERIIGAPIADVFAAVTGIDAYAGLGWVREATIVEDVGDDDDRRGTQRRVRAGIGGFVEEITDWRRPYRMGYEIRRAWPVRVPEHRGSIELRSGPDGTEVRWTSTFRVAVPVLPCLGRPATAAVAGWFPLLFTDLLNHAATTLDAPIS